MLHEQLVTRGDLACSAEFRGQVTRQSFVPTTRFFMKIERSHDVPASWPCNMSPRVCRPWRLFVAGWFRPLYLLRPSALSSLLGCGRPCKILKTYTSGKRKQRVSIGAKVPCRLRSEYILDHFSTSKRWARPRVQGTAYLEIYTFCELMLANELHGKCKRLERGTDYHVIMNIPMWWLSPMLLCIW